jgi:ABC-type sugar transport system ATPase subunit
VRRVPGVRVQVGRDRLVAVPVPVTASRDESLPGESPPSPGSRLLELRNVSKRFGPVLALRGVNLVVPAGEVTALAGDNGAGKSVLIKTIAGTHQPDGGQIYWEGRPVHIRTPRDAAALGIQTVYQDLALADNLDIVQNMFLGRERSRAGLLDDDSMETSATEALAGLSVTTVRSIRQPVASLSGGQRQAVAIARAVLWNSKLVVMDEPTAALGVAQTEMVLDLVRTLADRGYAVLLISHNLHDVFVVADRIAILHLGRLVATGTIGEFDPQTVVSYMTFGRVQPSPDTR